MAWYGINSSLFARVPALIFCLTRTKSQRNSYFIFFESRGTEKKQRCVEKRTDCFGLRCLPSPRRASAMAGPCNPPSCDGVLSTDGLATLVSQANVARPSIRWAYGASGRALAPVDGDCAPIDGGELSSRGAPVGGTLARSSALAACPHLFAAAAATPNTCGEPKLHQTEQTHRLDPK